MGQDGEDGQGGDVKRTSTFDEQLAQDRKYERSVSARMIVVWLGAGGLILAWFIAERMYS